jgi:hypothetical protein
MPQPQGGNGHNYFQGKIDHLTGQIDILVHETVNTCHGN